MRRVMFALLLAACSSSSAPPPPAATPLPEVTVASTETRAPCADRDPLRHVYFGDLHVHTGLSFDARVYSVIARPADAYRFARGESVPLPPFDASGKGAREAKLAVPLDFAAVTDHSEFLGETAACTTPGTAAYDSETCTTYREIGGADSIIAFGGNLSTPGAGHVATVCGQGLGVDCDSLAQGLWAETRAAAEQAYDRTAACRFTSFVGYEYSNSQDLSNYHRNVIFRNATVPDAPITFLDATTPQELWAKLRASCLEAGNGCDVLAIPHNPNWSNGHLFHVEYPGANGDLGAERAQAEARVAMEPLVEIFQHKGDSECSNGFPGKDPDPLCGFEKLVSEDLLVDCGETPGAGAMAGLGCTHRLDFVREVEKEGLKEAARIGANPFQLGFIASTDTHAALPGGVDESSWAGHLGIRDDRAREKLEKPGAVPGGIVENPGGLAAVWAVENSRDALFEALRRRETYGTSGPRIVVRFFGGPSASYPPGLCADAELTAKGYAGGVPMGGTLAAGTVAPTFVVHALRDPRDGATPLERVQIVKGWLDEGGVARESVTDVAATTGTATVDPSTCARSGTASDELCAVWTDPGYVAGQRAFWYARVVEAPSCRWTAWVCKDLTGADRPAECDDPNLVRLIQERAWTSPIWSGE